MATFLSGLKSTLDVRTSRAAKKYRVYGKDSFLVAKYSVILPKRDIQIDFLSEDRRERMRFMVFLKLDLNDSLTMYMKCSEISLLDEKVLLRILCLSYTFQRWKFRKNIDRILMEFKFVSHSIIETIRKDSPEF